LLSEHKSNLVFPHNCNYSYSTLGKLETSVRVIAITLKASQEATLNCINILTVERITVQGKELLIVP